MAGKHKKKQVKRKSLSSSTISSNQINTNQSTSNKSKTKLKKSKEKSEKAKKLETSQINPNSSKKKITKRANTTPISSADSDTGSQISKRRRREPRTTVSDGQTPTSSNIATSSSHNALTSSNAYAAVAASAPTTSSAASPKPSNSRRRRNLDNPTTSTSSRSCSTANKRNSSSSVTSTKFNLNYPGSIYITGNPTTTSGSSMLQSHSTNQAMSIATTASSSINTHINASMDISHFHNYLSSRSMVSSDIGEQINKKLDELRSCAGDRSQEYLIMTEINQHLLVSYEDSLNCLRVGELANQVVNIIDNCDDQLVDLKTICYNILLHLIEAMPRSSDYLVASLAMFLQKISNLFDFDSLEQIINVIERISRRHGQAVLQSGAFTIIINYYDFLTAPQQLTILNMISQCFQTLSSSDFAYIIDGLDNLTSRLKQSEPKCVEKVIQCFVRLVNAYHNDQTKLKRIASNSTTSLFANLQELLICSPPVMSDVRQIVRMMSVLCANCPDLAVDLIKQNITQTLLCVCNTKPYNHHTSIPTASSPSQNYNTSRSPDEILAIVTLISELMPPLPLNNQLFTINRILYPRAHSVNSTSTSTSTTTTTTSSSSSSSSNNNNHEYIWSWYNHLNKQWTPYNSTTSQIIERHLLNNEMLFDTPINNVTVKFNLILMQQSTTIGNSNSEQENVCDLKRVRVSNHHHHHHNKSSSAGNISSSNKHGFDEIKKDTRAKLVFQQCAQFENSAHPTTESGEELQIVELLRNVFPLVLDIYNEASSIQVKYKCLEAILRMIYPSSSKLLNSVLNRTALSSLMASLLSNPDSTIIIQSIQIGNLLQKLPSGLIFNFKKEGVLYQLEKTLNNWLKKSLDQIPTLIDQTCVDGNIETVDGTAGNNTSSTLSCNSSSLVPVTSSVTASSSTTQRITNWVKRSSCITGNRSSTSAVPSSSMNVTSQSLSYHPSDHQSSINSSISNMSTSKITRKQKSESDQALDMSMRPPQAASTSSSISTQHHQQAPSSNSNRKINQIMSLLNLNNVTSSNLLPTSSSIYSSCANSFEMIPASPPYYTSVHSSTANTAPDKSSVTADYGASSPNTVSYSLAQRELFCKLWILKFGQQLDQLWKEISDENSNIDLTTNLDSKSQFVQFNSASINPNAVLTTGSVKRDVLYYLKEIARDLQSDNRETINKCLKMLCQLLTNDCYISVFEMESSGINEALLKFIVGSTSKSADVQRENLLLFLQLFTNQTNNKSAFGCLVNLLMLCLHQQEQFHVRTFQFPTATTSTPTANAGNNNNALGMQLVDSSHGNNPNASHNSSSNTTATNRISKFSLTQALTEAVLSRMAIHRRGSNTNTNDGSTPSSSNTTVVSSNMLDARIIPSIFLDSHSTTNAAAASLTLGSSLHGLVHGHKVTDIICNFSAYPHDTHNTDEFNHVEKWPPIQQQSTTTTSAPPPSNNTNTNSNSSLATSTSSTAPTNSSYTASGMNSSFNVIVDVLSTVNNLEKMVMRELSKHRRLHKRFGGALSKEMSSMNDDSSDSDDDDDDDEDDYDDEEHDNDDDDDDIEEEDEDLDDEDDETNDAIYVSTSGSSNPFYYFTDRSHKIDNPGIVLTQSAMSDDDLEDDDEDDFMEHNLSRLSARSNQHSFNSRAANHLQKMFKTNKSITSHHASRHKAGASLNKPSTSFAKHTTPANTTKSSKLMASSQTSTPTSSTKKSAGGSSKSSQKASTTPHHNHHHQAEPALDHNRTEPSISPSPSQLHHHHHHLHQHHHNHHHHVVTKPISKIQIFIGNNLLSSDMSVYQAIRRYSPHIEQFFQQNQHHTSTRTDQQLEESINQLIWKSHHPLHYRLVCSTLPNASTNTGLFSSAFSPLKHSSANYYQRSIQQMNFLALFDEAAGSSYRHLLPQSFYSNFNNTAASSAVPSISPNVTSTSAYSTSSKITTRLRNSKKSTSNSAVNKKSSSTNNNNSSINTTSIAVTSKKRRKNNSNTDAANASSSTNTIATANTTASSGCTVFIGQNNQKIGQYILLKQLSDVLPYPSLIDYPVIFDPIPSDIQQTNKKSSISNDNSLNISPKLETTLCLLRCLYMLNRNWHTLNFNLQSNSLIPDFEFRSSKLTSKINRQLQDIFYVVARNIPFWCIQLLHSCAFLFSLETRQNFFYLFNFDRARTLIYLEGSSNPDSDNLLDNSGSEIRRVRVQVNRSERLLDESELLMKNQSDPRVVLEISFSNEAGFGLGPTNEFYTQVSKCLMKTDLNLWYTSGASPDDYVMPCSPYGLYPRPIIQRGSQKKLDTKLRNKFTFIGRLLARALLDCRKLDLPLNPVFYKWILNQQASINCADMWFIDPILANQLKSLQEMIDNKLSIDRNTCLNSADKKKAIEQLGIEDLQLVYVHPMYPSMELMKHGSTRVVKSCDDLVNYLDLIYTTSLVDGVKLQMECVLDGFDSLLPGGRAHLAALFEPNNLDQMFCGGSSNNTSGGAGSTAGGSASHSDDRHWNVRSLTEACLCDHGYTMTSRSIVHLFEIMSEFDRDQRRSFVQFCTGSSRLPVGGFKALRPLFKIVNKKEGGENPDNYLPSVMTCQNFLKLPDYSTKEIMRQRLLYALDEGQNAFYLS